MKDKIQFRMVAFTGAAGKSDPSAPMGGNEDNFYVDDNLSDNVSCHFDADKVLDLAEYGLIMAVADGMGGQNAGEVASGIAVSTVQEFFKPGMLNDKIVSTPDTRKKYLEKLVIEADRRIKEKAQNNPEHEGMGSTIIMAWIVDDKLTITWCGDSRAYRYNPAQGIELLSEDHSYVQELVKQKIISYEDTFDHPQGNIVTRSLGERGNKAQPETRQYNLYKDDIILLCSDGLSGVLRDRKTKDHNGEFYPGENIEDIIKENCTSMKQCKDALWSAAEHADWYDNVTIILCQILDGASNFIPKRQHSEVDETGVANNKNKSFWSRSLHITTGNIAAIIGIIIMIGLLIAGGLWIYPKIMNNNIQKQDQVEQKEQSKSIGTETTQPSDDPLSSLQEELYNLLQEKCAKFMEICDIEDMEKDKYFDKILHEISDFKAIEDSLSVRNLKENTDQFIELTKKRVHQLKEINKYKERYKGNRTVINRLGDLRNKCINEDIINFETEINKIIPHGDHYVTKKEPETTDESGEGDVLTRYPIGDNNNNPIEERFEVNGWPDFLGKVDDFKRKYGSTHKMKGVYVGDVLVYDNHGIINKNLLKTETNGAPTVFIIKLYPNH